MTGKRPMGLPQGFKESGGPGKCLECYWSDGFEYPNGTVCEMAEGMTAVPAEGWCPRYIGCAQIRERMRRNV